MMNSPLWPDIIKGVDIHLWDFGADTEAEGKEDMAATICSNKKIYNNGEGISWEDI